jgi:hypothetical protein
MLRHSSGGHFLTDEDTPPLRTVKYPHWLPEFEAAVLEGDPGTLRQRVDAAEAALFLRSQALAGNPQASGEQQAIADAVSKLRTIQKEKLGFPDWNGK